MTWETLLNHLVESWEEIRRSTILKGWEEYNFHGIDIANDDSDDDSSGIFSVDESVLSESSSEFDECEFQ